MSEKGKGSDKANWNDFIKSQQNEPKKEVKVKPKPTE